MYFCWEQPPKTKVSVDEDEGVVRIERVVRRRRRRRISEGVWVEAMPVKKMMTE